MKNMSKKDKNAIKKWDNKRKRKAEKGSVLRKFRLNIKKCEPLNGETQ